MTDYSIKTGDVFIREFDRGVVEYLIGATIQTSPITNKNNYYVTISGANPILVPVIFNNPEQVMENKVYPFIHVVREDVSPALQRWQSVGKLEYITSGTSAFPISAYGGVTGWSELEWKFQAWPFDILYRISCYARFEHEALSMLRFILRRTQINGRVRVIDSLNECRYYSTYVESSISDLSEIVDVTDRTKAYSISIRVEGELDLRDPLTSSSTVSGTEITSMPF